MIRLAITVTLTLTLAACGSGGEEADDSIGEAIRFVEGYACTGEHEQVRALSITHIDTVFGRQPFRYENTALSLWDGTPFVVDISSTFPNADHLLEVIAEEAEKIRAVLGYEVFVAGDVRPLTDVTASHFSDPNRAFQLTPPYPHIDILCCYYNPDSRTVGVASYHLRVAVLSYDEFWSRYAIIHELYHILGFMHLGETEGVVMSEDLMYGTRDVDEGISFPTQSAPIDLAKMACIYD